MKTLIELFDESPILNALAALAFHPEKLIFLGAENEDSRGDYERLFKSKGLSIEVEYATADMNNIDEVNSVLARLIDENKGCAVDVTGGHDFALLAAGMAAVKLGVPLIAYNRARGCYANIDRLPEASGVPIAGLLECRDFFTVSGGNIIESEDFSDETREIANFWKKVIAVWQVYCDNMGLWAQHVQYLQRVTSPVLPDGKVPLDIVCPARVKVNGKTIERNDRILSELVRTGALAELKSDSKGLRFRYAAPAFRRYLTDVGAFLELYIHACAMGAGKFEQVLSRVKYNWEYESAAHTRNTVFRPARNEIDVIATGGIEPLFISCKTSAPDMKYIDEIYPQAMRMSGGEGHAVFACTHVMDVDSPVYNKAKALGVYIIDGEDIKNGLAVERLRQMAESRYRWKDET